MNSNSNGWSQIEVAGHPCDVFEPPRPNESVSVVLYLHGVRLARLVENEVFTAEFARHGLRAICPMTGMSWWSDRITEAFDPNISAERYVLERVLPAIQERWDARPPQIGLLGNSMGGQGALRLAFKHPQVFPVVAAFSPAIDFQLRVREGDPVLSAMYADEEAARQDTATLHVHALNWPRNIWVCCDPTDFRWHDSAQKLLMKLSALGIPYESDMETAAGGHSFQYYNHMAPAAIRFLADRLERERLRLV